MELTQHIVQMPRPNVGPGFRESAGGHCTFVLFVSSGAVVDCWQSFDVPSATAIAEA